MIRLKVKMNQVALDDQTYQSYLAFQQFQALQSTTPACSSPVIAESLNQNNKSNSSNKSSIKINNGKLKRTIAEKNTVAKQLFNEPTHALVLWVNENKYTTVPYSNLKLEESESPEDGKVYKVKFGNKNQLYDGKLIVTGSKSTCESHLEQIQTRLNGGEEEESNLKEKTTTPVVDMSTKKLTKQDTEEMNKLKNKNQQLSDEIAVLKVKLTETNKLLK